MSDQNKVNKDPEAINFGAILESIMMDYELLADNYNTLMGILFEKNIINMEDWKKAMEKNKEDKRKAQEKVSGAINSNIPKKSQIIKL